MCIKSISLYKKTHQKMIQRELFTAPLLRESQYVVIVSDWFVSWSSPLSACLVMEFCNANLSEFLYSTRLKKSTLFPVTQLATLVYHISEALIHLENIGLVHRDINTSNILMKAENTEWAWKLADFGSSCISTESTSDGFCGTIPTASPEALKVQPLSSQSDIWSFGCVIWECVTLARPFKCVSLLEFQRSSKLPGEFPIDRYLVSPTRCVPNGSLYSKILKFVRKTMLVANHQMRASSRELHSAWNTQQCGSHLDKVRSPGAK